ncbi:acyloxyacyl hydrolase [Ignavibacterium sp.]|uniref:acyloxyacyl hydrolase n=1 Tax=Ignavibacterium sp. TaxID=2651167 RepID=UPI003458C6E6
MRYKKIAKIILTLTEAFCHREFYFASFTVNKTIDFTNSAIFSIGPVFLLNTLQKNISLSGGISPRLMTKHNFKNLDLGGSFNFISHIELMFSPTDNVSLG